MKMPLGAEPKKVVVLGGLLAVAGYLFYTNLGFGGGGGGAPSPKRSTPVASASAPAGETTARTAETRVAPPPGMGGRSRRAGPQEYKPSLRPRKAEEKLDPTAVDPTLRTDLLAKLEKVRIEQVERSLFDFSSPPVVKQPEPKIVPKPAEAAFIGPKPPPAPPPEPPKPVAPPVPLKFYGYQIPKAGGARRTFCLDGEDILTPLEGDTIKSRYKIVRIGLSSVVVEDLQFQSQQTLPILEDTGSGG
jgi:hypothetical protein